VSPGPLHTTRFGSGAQRPWRCTASPAGAGRGLRWAARSRRSGPRDEAGLAAYGEAEHVPVEVVPDADHDTIVFSAAAAERVAGAIAGR